MRGLLGCHGIVGTSREETVCENSRGGRGWADVSKCAAASSPETDYPIDYADSGTSLAGSFA